MNINPRVVKELHGNLPKEFHQIKDKIFYQEGYTQYSDYVWIPKYSIMDCRDESITSLPIFLSLKLAFENHPEFDSITLSNT